MTFTGVESRRPPVRTLPLTLRVPEAMLNGLAARARSFGNMPAADYAAQLLNAAYAARIGQEKAEIGSDRDLDAMVKLTLACAGAADSAAIGKFLGLDEALVMKILNGWRQVGKAKPGKAVAPVKAGAGQGGGMSEPPPSSGPAGQFLPQGEKEGAEAKYALAKEALRLCAFDKDALGAALAALIMAIGRDENGGGLLSRATIRAADEARLLLARLMD